MHQLLKRRVDTECTGVALLLGSDRLFSPQFHLFVSMFVVFMIWYVRVPPKAESSVIFAGWVGTNL